MSRRVLAILLMALLPMVATAKVNTSPKAYREAIEAWKFCYKLPINAPLVVKSYPELEPDVRRILQRFDDTFGGSCEAIERYLGEFYEVLPPQLQEEGTSWAALKQKLAKILDDEIAEDFAEYGGDTTNLGIAEALTIRGESLLLESLRSNLATLLAFHPAYQQYPAAELDDGWVQHIKYRERLAYSADLEVSITLPSSWAETKDNASLGYRYSDWRSQNGYGREWRSQNGYGYESIAIVLMEKRRNAAAPPVTVDDLQRRLDAKDSPFELSDDQTLQSASVVTLNNLPAMRISFSEGDTRSTLYVVFYGTTDLLIQTSVHNDTDELEARKALFDRIFDRTAKSFVLRPFNAE